MKSNRIAFIKSKSPLQAKTFEIRLREDNTYELNLIYPTSCNFGVFQTPGECKRKAMTICPLGIKTKKL